MIDYVEAAKSYSYNKVSGDLTNIKTGRIIKARSGQGYIVAKYKRNSLYAHRIAWAIMTGECPAGDIDHIDRNKSNNAWKNLRLVTRQKNIWNQDKPRGKSGYWGVIARGQRWSAYYTDARGRVVKIGLYDTALEAALARDIKVLRDRKQYARLNFDLPGQNLVTPTPTV